MNKKAIAILGAIFVLIVGTLGVIIYLRSRTTTPEPVTQPEVVQEPTTEELPNEETNTTPEPEQTGATKLIDDNVVTPALFFQGDGVAYFNNRGELFRTQMSVSGNSVLLSNKTQLTVPPKSGITKILWPLIGNSYIAQTGSSSAKRFSYYNPETGQYVDLPANIKSLVWLPSGNKIMYTWVGTDGKATLNIANPDATGYQTLASLYEADYELNISPDGQKILFYRTQPTDLSLNQITQVTSDGKIFTAVIKDGFNMGVSWSPDSQKFIFTRRNPSTSKFDLWYANVSTGEVKNLGVSTSIDKVIWKQDNQTIVAAIPTVNGDVASVIDTVGGSQSETSLGADVSAVEMFLNLNQDQLFFVNSRDGALYSIPLPGTEGA